MSDFDLSLETLKSTLFKVVQAGSQFGTSILAAQLLVPNLFGAAFVVLRVGITASTVVTGWADGLKKRFAERSVEPGEALGELFVLAGAWCVVAVVLGAMASGPLAALTGLEGAWVFVLVVVIAESTSIAVVKFFEAHGRLGVASGTKSLRYLLALPLQIGLLVLGHGVGGFVAGFLVATVLAVPVPFGLMSVRPEWPTIDQFREGWAFARYAIPNATIGATYHILDMVILSAVLSTAAAGHYEAAWTLTMPGVFVAAAAASGLIVKVSDLAERSENVASIIEETIAYTSVIAIPIFFGAAVLGAELVVVIFGDAYRPASVLLVGLSAFQAIRTQVAPLLQATYGLGRPDVVTRVTILSVVLNVSVGVGLTVILGAVGVVIATIAIEFVRYLWLARFMKRSHASLTLLQRPLLKQLSAGGAMALGLWGATTVISPNRPLTLFALVGVGGVLYATLTVTLDSSVRARVRDAVERL